jgi:hypothetical protein
MGQRRVSEAILLQRAKGVDKSERRWKIVRCERLMEGDDVERADILKRQPK